MPEDIQKTIERLDEEVQQRPGYAAYLYRAGLLLAVGRLDEAMRDCHAAMQMHPHTSRPHFMMSEILRRMGKDEEAQQAMDHARSLPKGGDNFEQELQQVLARIGGEEHPRPQQRPSEPRRSQRRTFRPPGRNGSM